MAFVGKCAHFLVLATILAWSSPVSSQTAQCSNAALTATRTAQNLTSPNYPSNYSSNANCRWTITAASSSDVVVLKLLDLELQGPSPSCTSDFVSIYDGSSNNMQDLCGQVSPTQFISTRESMTVVFQTDSIANYRGFKFEYISVNKSDLCNHTIFFSDGLWYTTGYPYSYTSNLDCSWILTAKSPSQVAVLNFVDFYLQGYYPSCNNDYLAIYDGNTTNSPLIRKLCGQVSNTQIVSSGMSLSFVFHSDSTSNYKGFKFEALSENKSAFCYNGTLSATGNPNYLMSPNYPNNYTSNTGCQWTIWADSSSEVVVLKVLAFELESSASCIYDYVAVYDGSSTSFPLLKKQCGTASSLSFASTGSYLTVVFHADELVNLMGFKFQYTSQPNPAQCADVSLTASTSANYFNSSNYPGQYSSNMDCKWFIKADSVSKVVVLDMIALSLDYSSSCTSDYVKIYDGPSIYSSVIATLCDVYYYGTYKSTGSDLTVLFHSDGVSSGNTGFQFSYKSEIPASGSSGTIDYKPSSSTSSSIYLPGYIAGPIIVIVVSLISTVCCRRRVVRRQLRATQMVRTAHIVTTAPAPRPAPPPMPAPNITANQNDSQVNVFFVTFESNNQAEAPRDTQSTHGTSGTQQILQAPPEPPRYSTLNIDTNAGLPPGDPRYPDYRANNLPPAYSEVAGGAAPYGQKSLPYDPKPDKSPFGLGSSSDEAGYANMGFSSDATTGPPTSSHRDTEPSAPVRDSIYNN